MNLKEFLKRIPYLIQLRRFLFPGSDPMGRFLSDFFRSKHPKTIVQVGANDGIMCDPLRPFLRKPGNYNAILIEPLPYYADKLRELYKDRSDVRIIQAAIGSVEGDENFYYLPPDVADTMNGTGPENNWAHGQGSFDRATIVHWIRENSFRGEEYRRNIPHFEASIASIRTKIRPTREFLPHADNLLVVIDVQGFELEVLNGIDWNHPPKYLILEDDLGGSTGIVEYMMSRNFRHVCGETDKLFELVR